MKNTLEDLRKEIDEIDNQLLAALAKRMNIVREIGKLKKVKKLEPLDEERWQEVVNRMKTVATKHKLPEDLVNKIYEEIHNVSLIVEKEI